MDLVRRSFVWITILNPHRKLSRRYRHHRPLWRTGQCRPLLTLLLPRGQFLGTLITWRCGHCRVRSEHDQRDQYEHPPHELPPQFTETNHDSLSHITQWAGTIKPRTSEKQPYNVSKLSGVAYIIHDRFCGSRRCSGKRHGAKGYGFQATSRRSVMNNTMWAKGYGVFAHRNPSSPWSVGEMRLRFAERMARGLLFQAPPRITLVPPVDGPVGFCDGLVL